MNGNLTKPPLKYGFGWVIASNLFGEMGSLRRWEKPTGGWDHVYCEGLGESALTFKKWIYEYIHMKQCLQSLTHGLSLIKPPLKWGRQLVITSHIAVWTELLIPTLILRENFKITFM